MCQCINVPIIFILFIAINWCQSAVLQPSYQVDTAWPDKSLVRSNHFGSSITLNKEGNVILLHRGWKRNGTLSLSLIPENTVMIVDKKTGKVLKEWGRNKFLSPHGLFLSQNGDIFITDTVMHQVFKFQVDNTTGLWHNEASLTLGQPFVPTRGKDIRHFCSPSDVVEDPDTGDFFVSDGYCNSRVVKFDKDGRYLLQFEAGTLYPGELPIPFNVAHALAIAHNSETQQNITNGTEPGSKLLLVADRNNRRIQAFDLAGNYKFTIGPEVFGPEDSMIMSMAVSNYSNTRDNRTKSFNFGKLFVIKGHLPVGQSKVFIMGLHSKGAEVISIFSTTKPTTTLPTHCDNCTLLETPHDIAVSRNQDEIYIVEAAAELSMKRFLKFNPNAKGVEKVSTGKNATGQSYKFGTGQYTFMFACLVILMDIF